MSLILLLRVSPVRLARCVLNMSLSIYTHHTAVEGFMVSAAPRSTCNPLLPLVRINFFRQQLKSRRYFSIVRCRICSFEYAPLLLPSIMLTPVALVSLLSALTAALPQVQPKSAPANLVNRQDINFDLVDSTPDPTVAPDDYANYNPTAALASVVAEVSVSPLPQTEKRDVQQRDIIVVTTDGYTANTALGNAALNAPLDCNKAVCRSYISQTFH